MDFIFLIFLYVTVYMSGNIHAHVYLLQLDGTSTARSRKWCLRHRAISQTKTEAIFQIQV